MAGVMRSASKRVSPKLSGKKFVIVVSRWNDDITEAMYSGARQALLDSGVKKSNILRRDVPGSFELPLAAKRYTAMKEIDAVICLGCVIQGETPHFDYICQAVANGIMQVNLTSGKPVAFGVLTTLDKKQALERAGGKYGNKGEEAAETVVRMLEV